MIDPLENGAPGSADAAHAAPRSALGMALIGLALLGLLVTIVGGVFALTSGFTDSTRSFEAEIDTLVENATTFEAPASIELPFEPGGAFVLIAPDGRVGDKVIGRPPSSVGYRITVKDASGTPVGVESAGSRRDPRSRIEILGWFRVPESGSYTVSVATADGSQTPVAIMIASGDESQVDRIVDSIEGIAQGFFGSCCAACGCVLLVGFGVAAIIVRVRDSRARQAPPPID